MQDLRAWRKRVATEESLASWLRRQLGRREWKYGDLAERAGVSTASISRWVNGKELPSSENAIKLAEALDADPDDVLALAGHRDPDRPVPPDDPIRELYRMMQRMKKNPDRIETLRAIVERYLENDRASREGLLSQAA